MGYKHVTEPYGPSQCQYLCNAAGAECAAFFAWYGEYTGGVGGGGVMCFC